MSEPMTEERLEIVRELSKRALYEADCREIDADLAYAFDEAVGEIDRLRAENEWLTELLRRALPWVDEVNDLATWELGDAIRLALSRSPEAPRD